MELLIVRHAWAGQPGDPQWPDDSQRPLSPKGRRRFKRMAKTLADNGVCPELIATSPMVRCRQTAGILADAVRGQVEVVDRAELLPDGSLEALLAWTAEHAAKHEQIAWVGHAPDVGRLAAVLIGCPGGQIAFRKGAVASLRFGDIPKIGDGQLRWLVTAGVLGV